MFRRSTVAGFLRSYLIILGVMLAMMGLAYVLVLRQLARDTLADRAAHLERIVDLVDSQMSEVRSLAVEIANDPRLRSVELYSAGARPATVYSVMSLQESLRLKVGPRQAVRNVVVYFARTGLLVTPTHAGLRTRDAYEALLRYEDLSFEDWQGRINSSHLGGAVWPAARVIDGTGWRWVLTCLQPFPIDDPASRRGVVAVLLDAESLLHYFASLAEQESGIVVASDPDGATLVSSGTVGSRSALVVERRSRSNGWLYRVEIPRTAISAKARETRRVFALIAALALLAGVASSVLLSLQASGPVLRLVRRVEGLVPSDEAEAGDGYRRLEAGVERLARDDERLREALDRYLPVVRASLLGALLRGQIVREQDVRDELERLGVRIAGGAYAVALIAVAGAPAGEPEDGRSEAAVVTMALEAALDGLQRGGGLAHPVDSRHVAVLIVGEAAGDPGLESSVEACLARFAAGVEPLAPVRIGVGEWVSSLAEVPVSFRQAWDACRAAVAGGRIVRHGDLPPESTGWFYPLDLQQRFVSLVTLGEGDEALSLWKRLCQVNLVERRLSEQDAALLVAEISGTFRRIAAQLEVPLSDAVPFLSDVRARMESEPDRDRFATAGQDAIEWLAAAARRRSTNRGRELTEAIVAFVDANYARWDMGLGLVADRFRITEPYLSSFFREHVGRHFQAYVTELRMRRARALIEAGEGVAEAARAVGYQNATSFSRAFRRHWGRNPRDWKSGLAASGA